MIELSNNLPIDYKTNIVHPVLQNNAYWAHAENILLAGIFDENRDNREIATTQIIEARILEREKNTIRVFKPPKIDFSAANYFSLIDWKLMDQVKSPPILQYLSDEDIVNAADSPLSLISYP